MYWPVLEAENVFSPFCTKRAKLRTKSTPTALTSSASYGLSTSMTCILTRGFLILMRHQL